MLIRISHKAYFNLINMNTRVLNILKGSCKLIKDPFITIQYWLNEVISSHFLIIILSFWSYPYFCINMIKIHFLQSVHLKNGQLYDPSRIILWNLACTLSFSFHKKHIVKLNYLCHIRLVLIHWLKYCKNAGHSLVKSGHKQILLNRVSGSRVDLSGLHHRCIIWEHSWEAPRCKSNCSSRCVSLHLENN